MINYSIVVTKDGNQSLANVTVTDTLYDVTEGTLKGPTESGTTDGILSLAETFTYTISYTVTQADIDSGANLINRANVVTTELPTPDENTDTTAVTQSPSRPIDTSHAAGDDPGTAAGDVINYSNDVTNSGERSLTHASVPVTSAE